MGRSRVDVWVGFFVLLGGVAILFLALQAANLLSLSFQNTYTVTARFDNSGGLKPKAAVRSAGVVVGRVDSIAFDPKTFQADVVLAIESRYAFPKDTSAKILTSGLLGEQYVGLQPGYETDVLKSGDVVANTQSAVVLENLISQFLYNQAGKSEGAGASVSATPALGAPLPSLGGAAQ